MTLTLKDTADMMSSSDYKGRFQAEYYQLVIRYGSLKNMIKKWDNGTLSFTPTCPRNIYDMQLKAMKDYLNVLKVRATMEDVEIVQDIMYC